MQIKPALATICAPLAHVVMRVFVFAILAACSAVTAYMVWQIYIELPISGGTHPGVLVALPLICFTYGQLISLTRAAFRAQEVGPLRLLVAEMFFLATMTVIVVA